MKKQNKRLLKIYLLKTLKIKLHELRNKQDKICQHVWPYTTGDKIRLGDTELFIEIEKDFTVYGDEAKFGGGKTIRDGMAQSATSYKK